MGWKKEANGYRLPTEAEWEYCARACKDTFYSGSNNIDVVAWYRENYYENSIVTHPVGQKKGNAFGLYDMNGNVWEWVWDTAVFDDGAECTGGSTYLSNSRVDPVVDASGINRIPRGGSWGLPCVGGTYFVP